MLSLPTPSGYGFEPSMLLLCEVPQQGLAALLVVLLNVALRSALAATLLWVHHASSELCLDPSFFLGP